MPDAPGTQHPLITRRFEGDPSDSLLLTDLYQLNMLQAYNDGTMAGDVLTLEDDPALASSELDAYHLLSRHGVGCASSAGADG